MNLPQPGDGTDFVWFFTGFPGDRYHIRYLKWATWDFGALEHGGTKDPGSAAGTLGEFQSGR